MTSREWFPVSSQRLRFSATGLICLVREYSRPLTPLRKIGFSLWLLLYPMLYDPRRMAWSSRPNRVFFRVHLRLCRRGSFPLCVRLWIYAFPYSFFSLCRYSSLSRQCGCLFAAERPPLFVLDEHYLSPAIIIFGRGFEFLSPRIACPYAISQCHNFLSVTI